MRSLWETSDPLDARLISIFEKLTTRRLEEVMYLLAGYGLRLHQRDVNQIKSILEASLDMYSVLGQILVGKEKNYSMDYFGIPVTESCYENIKEIVLNEYRILAPLHSTYIPLYFIFENKKYNFGADCLFKMEDGGYYLFGKAWDWGLDENTPSHIYFNPSLLEI